MEVTECVEWWRVIAGHVSDITQHHGKEKIVVMIKTVIFNLLEVLIIAKT
jgi:hypothetical protein